ncbi:Protein of unknown function [Gryllus bimaculatus]|nr:Protein of unknown function [Gryllus bimaculatus]
MVEAAQLVLRVVVALPMVVAVGVVTIALVTMVISLMLVSLAALMALGMAVAVAAAVLVATTEGAALLMKAVSPPAAQLAEETADAEVTVMGALTGA